MKNCKILTRLKVYIVNFIYLILLAVICNNTSDTAMGRIIISHNDKDIADKNIVKGKQEFENSVIKLIMNVDIGDIRIRKGDKVKVCYQKKNIYSKKCDIKFKNYNGKLEININNLNPTNSENKCVIDFDIFLPQTYTKFDIRLSSGEILLEDIPGKARAKMSYGKFVNTAPLDFLEVKAGYLNADIKNLRGDCVLKSGNGHYKVHYDQMPPANGKYLIQMKTGNLQGVLILPKQAKVKNVYTTSPMYAKFNNKFPPFLGTPNFIIESIFAEGKLDLIYND